MSEKIAIQGTADFSSMITGARGAEGALSGLAGGLKKVDGGLVNFAAKVTSVVGVLGIFRQSVELAKDAVGILDKGLSSLTVALTEGNRKVIADQERMVDVMARVRKQIDETREAAEKAAEANKTWVGSFRNPYARFGIEADKSKGELFAEPTKLQIGVLLGKFHTLNYDQDDEDLIRTIAEEQSMQPGGITPLVMSALAELRKAIHIKELNKRKVQALLETREGEGFQFGAGDIMGRRYSGLGSPDGNEAIDAIGQSVGGQVDFRDPFKGLDTRTQEERKRDAERKAAKEAAARRREMTEEEREKEQAHQADLNRIDTAANSAQLGINIATAIFGRKRGLVVAEAMLQGGMETARAFAEFAVQNYAGGIAHLAAAAQFFAVARGGGGGGGGGGGARPPMMSGFIGGGGGGGTRTTIIYMDADGGDPHAKAVKAKERERAAERAGRIRWSGATKFE